MAMDIFRCISSNAAKAPMMISIGTTPRTKSCITCPWDAIKEAIYKINTNLANSEGWKEGNGPIFSQRFAPFSSCPQNITAIISNMVTTKAITFSFSKCRYWMRDIIYIPTMPINRYCTWFRR